MKVINLASGSEGNMTFIQTDEGCFFVDMGLCVKEVELRIAFLKILPHQIDGVIVTHQHSDHIKGIDAFCTRNNIPVYAHHEVWRGMNEKLKRLPQTLRKTFADDSFFIKDLHIFPFALPHDVPCFGFCFENNQKKISILTDLGHTNDRILKSIQNSHLVYLEANYDLKMLQNNPNYPMVLKRRIAGKFGHLSNENCADVIEFLVRNGTLQIVLSHMSQKNNQPDFAFKRICSILENRGIVEGKNVKIDIASPLPGVMFNLK